MPVIINKIAYKKYTKEQIFEKEREIFVTLNFSISIVTPFETLTLAFEMLNIRDELYFDCLEQMSIFLLKMISHDYQILNEIDNVELAASIIFISMKIIQNLDFQFSLKKKVISIISI